MKRWPEKRARAEIVRSSSLWRDGQLSVTFREPFDMIAKAVAHAKAEKPPGDDPDGLRLSGGPFVDRYRTLCEHPLAGIARVLGQHQSLRVA